MHILALIVSVLGGILFVIWRMQQAANATRDIAEAAGEVRGFFRRWQWWRKANANPMDLVEDPKEAAAAMLVAVAQADGPLSEKERAAILAQMREEFGIGDSVAEELLARGRWLAKDSVDPANVFRRLTPLILKSLAPPERRSLVGMLHAVAAVDGRDASAAGRDIERLKQALQI
jgi:uncharacterized tellurite resistance protein B-like protein